jgi:hypothetical protein
MSSVQHVVLVRWRHETPEDVRARARALTRGLESLVPGIVRVSEGPSVSTEGLESGFTWGFVITMASAQALADYLPHPEHRRLADLIGEHSSAVTVFDIADIADIAG